MTLKEIREHIENMKFFNNGDQIILALSGGPDSACLFYILNQIKSELDLSISCVHVNHGLRGKASDTDEDFVRSMCKKNNCNLRVVSADINALAKEWKLSTEEAGRKVRYQAFYQEAEKVFKAIGVAPKILIAHNMDDQAETILFRIIRGTGVTGLKAMQKSEITPKGFEILRPLLGVTKRDILEALQSEKLPYCEDKTNELPIYARNKIRLDIIPAIESINPAFKEAIVRLGEIASEQEDFLDREAKECLRRLKYEHKINLNQSISILPANELGGYHVAIQKRVLSHIIKSMGLFENISSKHMEALVELLKSQNPSMEIDLPFGFKACRMYEEIVILSEEFLVENNSFTMKISTVDKLPKNIATKEKIEVDNADENFQSTYYKFENDKMCFNVFISKTVFEQKYGNSKRPILRYRNPGDYMILKGGVKKKVKNIFVDDKIPRILRNRVPLLAVGSEIIWMGDLTGCSNGRMSGDFQVGSSEVENNCESGLKGWFHIEILR
ncbi:MAG: tRNA lysidine(34) synthetase TilS [Clostridiales bacterium]|nr:tRNA lysidine(34) synthetase TilS [Clostridiales bacterium]MDY6116518.1 tRNA lysidine(34) synthetase TilS [Anaerovoracaceae bacterium]